MTDVRVIIEAQSPSEMERDHYALGPIESEGWAYAITADHVQVGRWREALIAWEDAQREMGALWDKANAAYEAEEDAKQEREAAADAAELQAEREATERLEAKLEAEHGPREWVVVQQQGKPVWTGIRSQNVVERTFHNTACSVLSRVLPGKITAPPMRLPQALEELARPITETLPTAKACSFCTEALIKAAK